ncbi:MAG: TonB-dependent receptor, partial [Bacteroidia bacterium]|nr:TonB-dependent receptor [Bacteroidia bacterium]
IIYNAAKKINQMSNVELNDNRIPATGNPNWMIYNLSTAWIISDKSRLNFIVENLFDVNYRVFSSGINAPGRNFNATYYFSF